MKTECSIVRDLLPLYIEDMVNPETAQYVSEHLAECDECKADLVKINSGAGLAEIEKTAQVGTEDTKPFKKMMKRMNRQFYGLAYSLVIIFIFLGFSWTAGDNLMYNSLIMPIVGVFGYYVFRWKAIYKMPLLLLVIDTVACLFGLVELDFFYAVVWTGIYSIFVFVGIAIAFLLHYAMRKENDK